MIHLHPTLGVDKFEPWPLTDEPVTQRLWTCSFFKAGFWASTHFFECLSPQRAVAGQADYWWPLATHPMKYTGEYMSILAQFSSVKCTWRYFETNQQLFVMIVMVPFLKGQEPESVFVIHLIAAEFIIRWQPRPKPVVPKSRIQLIGWPNMLTLKTMRHSTISREPTSSAESDFSAVDLSKKQGCIFETRSVMFNEKIGMEERPCPSPLITSSSLEPKCGGGMRVWHFRGALQRGIKWWFLEALWLWSSKHQGLYKEQFLSQNTWHLFLLNYIWVGFIDVLCAILSGGLHIPSYLFHRCMCPLAKH